MSRPKLRRDACLPDDTPDPTHVIVFVVVLSWLAVFILSGYDVIRAVAVVGAAIALAAQAVRQIRISLAQAEKI